MWPYVGLNKYSLCSKMKDGTKVPLQSKNPIIYICISIYLHLTKILRKYIYILYAFIESITVVFYQINIVLFIDQTNTMHTYIGCTENFDITEKEIIS